MLCSSKNTQIKYIEGNTNHRRGFYDFNSEKNRLKNKIKNVSVCKPEVLASASDSTSNGSFTSDVNPTVKGWYCQQLAFAPKSTTNLGQ